MGTPICKAAFCHISKVGVFLVCFFLFFPLPFLSLLAVHRGENLPR